MSSHPPDLQQVRISDDDWENLLITARHDPVLHGWIALLIRDRLPTGPWLMQVVRDQSALRSCLQRMLTDYLENNGAPAPVHVLTAKVAELERKVLERDAHHQRRAAEWHAAIRRDEQEIARLNSENEQLAARCEALKGAARELEQKVQLFQSKELTKTYRETMAALRGENMPTWRKQTAIFGAIVLERRRQEEKFKGGNTCAGPLPVYVKLGVLGEEFGEVARALNDSAPIEQLRAELIQVAAVAVAWVEAIDGAGELAPAAAEEEPTPKTDVAAYLAMLRRMGCSPSIQHVDVAADQGSCFSPGLYTYVHIRGSNLHCVFNSEGEAVGWETNGQRPPYPGEVRPI